MAEATTTLLDGTEANASGRCRLCNRKLTSARSIALGIGCTCRKAIGMDGGTRRNRAHAKRKKLRALRMEQEMNEQAQLKFEFMTAKEKAA